ncbi:PREDICTED: protein TsetseEP-like [Cyprinodon variegatus]|uniref:protein TsetseEP-like n=1 Tax=Cyprinodon variegatus TaxID=28743 RepID=UPI00074291C8|nr:PREDICTED: protein TsetseEP-like [Cyprinodon variegatus]
MAPVQLPVPDSSLPEFRPSPPSQDDNPPFWSELIPSFSSPGPPLPERFSGDPKTPEPALCRPETPEHTLKRASEISVGENVPPRFPQQRPLITKNPPPTPPATSEPELEPPWVVPPFPEAEPQSVMSPVPVVEPQSVASPVPEAEPQSVILPASTQSQSLPQTSVLSLPKSLWTHKVPPVQI